MSGIDQMKLREVQAPAPWREEMFLQQLSENGSLLLATNHDPVWLESYRIITSRSDATWELEQHLLRTLPAFLVRRTLWRVSKLWWIGMLAYREELARYALYRGAFPPALESLDYRLEIAGRQLDSLFWCSEDTDPELIDVIEK